MKDYTNYNKKNSKSSKFKTMKNKDLSHKLTKNHKILKERERSKKYY
jgi:hypothetical protein